MRSRRSAKAKWFFLAVLVLATIAGWWQRGPILAWYYVHQLCGASHGASEAWAKRAAALDEAVAPRLLDALRTPDATACLNVRQCLGLITKAWGPTDPRTTQLLERAHGRFRELSPSGQMAILVVT